jgi:cytochrome c553
MINSSTAILKNTAVFSFALLTLVFNSSSVSAETHNDVLAGKNIYLYGKLPSGKDLVATTVADVELKGKKAACTNCHKRSGLGSNEGTTIAPPIIGEILFSAKKIKAHRLKSATTDSVSALDRPAYTRETLMHTLVNGIDARGKQLQYLMPRYTLAQSDFNNLYAYLGTLSTSDKAVTDKILHIATVIDTRVSQNKQDIVTGTLKKYVSELNAQTRHETKRASNAPIQKEWHYQSYRKIKLHIWELSGKPETWTAQLNKYYSSTPVFAITSGISNAPWSKVDQFCNAKEIACILPNTRVPGLTKDNFYTLYYSTGPYNDAYVLAKYMKQNKQDSRILQISDHYSYSKIAKKVITEELTNTKNISLENVEREKDFIKKHISNETTVIIWSEIISDTLIKELSANAGNIKSIFIPYFLALDMETRKKLEKLNTDVFTSYPYVKPKGERIITIRAWAWARSRKLNLSDIPLLTNTFTSMVLLNDAIKHVRSNFNQAYIIETLEHMVDNSVVTGIYPKLSIGPGQRYASRGGNIMKVPVKPEEKLQEVSEWILPDKKAKLTQPSDVQP